MPLGDISLYKKYKLDVVLVINVMSTIISGQHAVSLKKQGGFVTRKKTKLTAAQNDLFYYNNYRLATQL